MAIVASNTVKECDPKTLLKSSHCDLNPVSGENLMVWSLPTK